MEETKNKKQEIKEIEITEIATQTADAFKLPDGKVVSINEYLVWLGNLVLSIKRQTVGN